MFSLWEQSNERGASLPRFGASGKERDQFIFVGSTVKTSVSGYDYHREPPMKGDFSRDSFDSARHFTRVLLQQGRVLTDADFNEQAAIQQHFLRAFVVDLVGRRWRVGDGFAIGRATAEDFTIGAGRFYLGGMA